MHEHLIDGGTVRKLWIGETTLYREHLLRLDPERYALDSDRVPATYGEFLFRSFTPRWREPAATERAAGAQVRSVAFRDASKRQTRR